MVQDLRLEPPEGMEAIRDGRRVAWVRAAVRDWVINALANAPSLYHAAREEAGGVSALEGRAPVYVVPPNAPRWLVRHYVRGGSVAPVLGDRYFRIGVPRPFRESLASASLDRVGISTPTVLAAAVYPSGAVYRADLVTRFLPGTRDLADLCFPAGEAHGSSSTRPAALAKAGTLVRRLAETGILHPDLNAKNLLVSGESESLELHLIDLDRLGPASGDRDDLARRMQDRLERSLRKWEARVGSQLSNDDWAALARGVSGRT